jgi:protein-L-isoaspartate(D-aspartate) O-methyltransferase
LTQRAREMTGKLALLFPGQNPRVLEAMSSIPRDIFVDPGWRRFAYSERSLPIGHGQTISKPATVLRMLNSMEPVYDGRLLEVGSGSGYLAAVASRLFSKVFCVERVLGLVEPSRANIGKTGARNVMVKYGDGSAGWPAHAPFNGILYSAGAPSFPESLKDQLAPGGLAGVPVGPPDDQVFTVWRKDGDGLVEVFSFQCSFVPLIGKEGWDG